MDGTFYDLCIVGAGMFGSAAARHASATVGIKVCLVGPDEPTAEEMLTREIFGSHYDEGRITSSLEDHAPSAVLTKNCIKSYRDLENLSDISFYHPVGCLWVLKKNSSFLNTVLQVADAVSLPIVDLSSNSVFERRYPYMKLRADDHPLLDDVGAGYINPRRIIEAQKKVAKTQGCDIIGRVVEEVKPFMNKTHEIVIEGGDIIKAKRVLFCTGAFTNFKKFPMPKLKVNINKETAAMVKIPYNEAQRLSAMPAILVNRQEDKIGAYILPPVMYPNGSYYLKIGHMDFEGECVCIKTLNEVKRWYLSNGDAEKIEYLSKLLIQIIPGLSYDDVTPMTCVTSHNVSGLPYIGRVSPTVTVAAVGNGRGAQHSDEVGRIAATLSITGKWESKLSKSLFRIIPEAS